MDVPGDRAAVDLHWIPLGAGQRVVRISGKTFEALSALVHRRRPCDLYHSALEVTVPEGRFVIEMTPIVDGHGARRGVVAEGPVGMKWAGRFRLFRYEIRRWHEGSIPDIGEATATISMAVDLATAQRLLDLVPVVPTPVWGRDELDTGEMWNSNSVTSWLLARSNVDVAALEPPVGGRAPGWDAGRVGAARDLEQHAGSRLPTMVDEVTVTREIDAPAEQLWAMVSDVTRMGEWSPENVGGTWLSDATGPRPGAKFRGSNRIGKRRWNTVATVVDADPGRRFSFRVTTMGLKVAEWSYTFEPTATGCRVTETWNEQRAGFLKPVARLVTGVADRATHNRAGMEKTLERLAAVAEHSSAL